MSKNHFKNYNKSNDWVVFCDICGMPCWASQAVELDEYTGKGDLIVCPNDRDAIDYGLIPYVVEAEEPPPFTRIDPLTTTAATQIDFRTYNPLSGSSPSGSSGSSLNNWEDIITNWENLTTNWEDLN